MLTSKKLLIAAVCCAVAGYGSVMFGMNNNGFGSSSSLTTRPSDKEWFEAILTGNTREVIRLIGAGANVNAQDDKSGMTALMYAAQYGQGVVGVLITATIAADKATNEALKAAHISSSSSSSLPPEEEEEVNSLNIQDKQGSTALHYLVNRAILVRTLPRYITPINSLPINSRVGLMLNKGTANPMIPNNAGETPVGLAQKFGVYDQLPALKNYVKKWNQMVKGDSLPGNDRYMIPDVVNIVNEY